MSDPPPKWQWVLELSVRELVVVEDLYEAFGRVFRRQYNYDDMISDSPLLFIR
jgi:hypothetical protein